MTVQSLFAATEPAATESPGPGLRLDPIAPLIGAVVSGTDLAQPLAVATVAALNQALLRHHVLFFRNQRLTPRQHRDFAARFGDLHIHPLYPNHPEEAEIIVLDTHPDNPPDNDNWHTDVTFIETPPMGSILYARQVPATGGDTTWSSMPAAFEALSPALQRLLLDLTAVHDLTKSFPQERWGQADGGAKWEQAKAKNPPVVHPVVRTHPETGRRCLFVNEGFTTHIRELSRKESDAILGLLFAHVARPEFTCRWRWQPGDVAFWDNRCTQHYALADYLPQRRVMNRATVLGDRPY